MQKLHSNEDVHYTTNYKRSLQYDFNTYHLSSCSKIVFML